MRKGSKEKPERQHSIQKALKLSEMTVVSFFTTLLQKDLSNPLNDFET